MSKYQKLWNYLKDQSSSYVDLTFEQVELVAGIPLDHSFLSHKKELLEFGWNVKKVHMKEKLVEFVRA